MFADSARCKKKVGYDTEPPNARNMALEVGKKGKLEIYNDHAMLPAIPMKRA